MKKQRADAGLIQRGTQSWGDARSHRVMSVGADGPPGTSQRRITPPFING